MEVSKRNYYALLCVAFVFVLMVLRERRPIYDPERWSDVHSAVQHPELAVGDAPTFEPTSSTTQTAFAGRPLVPKYVHLIWFYPPETSFRFHHLMCLMSVKLHIKPDRIIFWHSHQPKGPWWAFAKKTVSDIGLMPYDAPTSVYNQSVTVVEHQSDIARLDILIKYGGIYLDLDVVALKDFAPLLRFPVTLGAETPRLLGSGVILAEPNATFLQLWRQSYRKYEPTKWNYNSVVVPMELAKQRAAGDVHIEWFTIHRPNWFERQWLYAEGKLWDWSDNFAIHLWYRTHNADYDPISIRTLNNTVGEIFRFIYYGSPELLQPT